MNSEKQILNWALLQSFAAVVDSGSLSAAAREFNLSQPTLSRHITELEKNIGQRLFYRTTKGLLLTPEGEYLAKHVAKMNNVAHNLSLQLAETESITGTVRITASQIVATYILPNILTDMHEVEPNIEVEVVASDRTDNLLRREADIAIRMYRPTQDDVITKKVGEFELGMFAANSYIEQNGTPSSMRELLDHNFIGYDRSPLIIDGFKRMGIKISRNFFSFRSDDQVVCWQMVLAGLGIGFNQREIGMAERQVTLIDAGAKIESLPIWLTAHNELQSSSRVRFVYDFLASHLNK